MVYTTQGNEQCKFRAATWKEQSEHMVNQSSGHPPQVIVEAML